MCKINHALGRNDEVKKLYLKLLKEYSALLMENEKSINNLLDYLSSSIHIKDLYDETLAQLEKNGNKVISIFHFLFYIECLTWSLHLNV